MILKTDTVVGLKPTDATIVNSLQEAYTEHKPNNDLRMSFYLSHNRLKDLGISIPKSLEGSDTAIGWPAKAVDMLAVRSRFDGYTFAEDVENDLTQILIENDFHLAYQQGVTSELIMSPALITVTRGDTAAGEPKVVMNIHSADVSVSLWDYRRKRLKAAMTIADVNKRGKPTALNVFTDTDVITITLDGRTGRWGAVYAPHRMGRPLADVMTYRPSLTRPMGKSRITRSVMRITDSAMRTALRGEISAELFTAPQKYVLGADDELFADGKWNAYIGSVLAISKDEDGDVPTVGQFPQASMQPHIEYMRSLAAQFSGETSIPMSSLGVVSEANPTSAEAIYAAQEDLIIEAQSLNETNGRALRNVGLMALAINGDKTLADLTPEERSIMPRFMNPASPSLVSQADAMSKMIAAIPFLADTDVALEEFGFNQSQIMRLKADKRKVEANTVVNALIGADNVPA